MAYDRSDGALVGRGGLSRTVLSGETVLEVGWVVRDELTGRGYASEIGQAALDWAATFFPQLPVVAFTEVTTSHWWGSCAASAFTARASSTARGWSLDRPVCVPCRVQ